MKKFSIGLSLINCSIKEWKLILKKYKNNITYIYYSPNLENFFSRGKNEELKKINDKEQYEILNFARKLNIKTELAINTFKNFNEDFLIEVLKKEKEKHSPDFIVTYQKYLNVCLKIFPKCEYTLSYNEGIFKIEDLNKIDKRFKTIILGNRWIRNKEIFKKCKELGFKTELLVNNGCSHNCLYCFNINPKTPNCKFFFDMNISKHTIDVLVGVNTIFPYEIYEKYEQWNLIDNYKLSTRPMNFKKINFLMNLYINNIEITEKIKKKEEFNTLLSLKHYSDYEVFINLEDVYKVKIKEWEIFEKKEKIFETNNCNIKNNI